MIETFIRLAFFFQTLDHGMSVQTLSSTFLFHILAREERDFILCSLYLKQTKQFVSCERCFFLLDGGEVMRLISFEE